MANGNRIQGLLSGGNPLFDLGIGLLSASGPRPQGTANFGSRIGEAAQFASARQQAAQANEFLRQQMLARQRQQQAQQQLAGLLSAPERTPEGQPLPAGQGVLRTQDQIGQPELLGLLAQANPQGVTQALTQGLLGPQQQQRADPAPVRIARFLTDPNESEEAKAEVRKQIAAKGDDQALEQIRLLTQRAQLENLTREQDLAEQTVDQQQRALQVNSRRTFNSVKKVINLTEQLEESGVLLQPGNPLARQLRQGLALGAPFARATGFDGTATEWQNAVSVFDQLDKELNSLQLEVAGLSGSRAPTNFALESVQRATANIGITPDAIRGVSPTIVQGLLDAAEIEGLEFGELQEMRQFIDTLQGGVTIDNDSGSVLDLPEMTGQAVEAGRRATARVAEIGRMGAEQLRSLDFDALTQEQRDAVAKRLDDLGI